MTRGIRIALAILATAVAIGEAQAQTWPTKPLRAFIPFAAGSATDLVPRAVFEPLATELGQPIVVENRGGAGGTIAGTAVVRADPDGHTMLATGSKSDHRSLDRAQYALRHREGSGERPDDWPERQRPDRAARKRLEDRPRPRC